jgi:PAS domain S-box-containing protein
LRLPARMAATGKLPSAHPSTQRMSGGKAVDDFLEWASTSPTIGKKSLDLLRTVVRETCAKALEVLLATDRWERDMTKQELIRRTDFLEFHGEDIGNLTSVDELARQYAERVLGDHRAAAGEHAKMTTKLPLRVLLLEDNSHDAELIEAFLQADGFACDIMRVQTEAEFATALSRADLDVILADYQLPSFDGLSAFKLALAARPEVPFIFVSGTLGEEVAIEALKTGATDYVLKSGLSRLVPSAKRALAEAKERAERKKAEQALRRSEAYLAEAQRLSHTGSFGWNVGTGQIFWSDETHRIFGSDPTTTPSLELVLDRVHPDDRPRARKIFERASTERSDFSAEPRLMMPDGAVKYVRVLAHRTPGEEPGGLFFVGAVTDVTELKRADEEREKLRQLEAEIARFNRVSMMGELAASLTHEIKQPVAGIAADARAVLNWLRRASPEIEEACESVSCIIKGADHVAQIVDHNRALYSRERTQCELIDLNEIIRQMIALLQTAANRQSISIRATLDPDLPTTTGDSVQLRQVLMNLMLNGIEAMTEEKGELNISSQTTDDGQLEISISDAGSGLPLQEPERIFDAFFTTKASGTGMGLAISRRIIESHGGRLWARANCPRGAVFQFAVPTRMLPDVNNSKVR